jgi:hypothetical protein
MATRKAGSRLETEIERCRSECQWERIPELVKQLSAKLIANGRRGCAAASAAEPGPKARVGARLGPWGTWGPPESRGMGPRGGGVPDLRLAGWLLPRQGVVWGLPCAGTQGLRF